MDLCSWGDPLRRRNFLGNCFRRYEHFPEARFWKTYIVPMIRELPISGHTRVNQHSRDRMTLVVGYFEAIQ
jgi:hypothetical protein